MKLLCHRGWWIGEHDKNSVAALRRALERGHGIETDLRDLDGTVVVSHDPPRRGALEFEALLGIYSSLGIASLLALNVKADGLQEPVKTALDKFGVRRYFVFDMSVPDTLGYARRGIPYAARLSEYEMPGALFAATGFVWLDAFESEWYSQEQLCHWLRAGMKICVVSPELHRRSHGPLWQRLRQIPADLQGGLYLCTDLFDEALEVFEIEKD